jgi:hypothetical protein
VSPPLSVALSSGSRLRRSRLLPGNTLDTEPPSVMDRFISQPKVTQFLRLFQCWDFPIKGVPENLCSGVNLSTTGEIVSSITLEPFPIKSPPMGHC